MARPSWTIRLPDRSSGPTSPRFSCHRRIRAFSSWPMMMRASEPPMKSRRCPSRPCRRLVAFTFSSMTISLLHDKHVLLAHVTIAQLMTVTSAQVRMARAALNWTVRDLAEATGLHRNTVTNLEVGRYAGDPETLSNIKRVLEKAGVEFVDENGGGPGVRLRDRSKRSPGSRAFLSRVAAIQQMTGCFTRLMALPVLRSYHCRLRSSVTSRLDDEVRGEVLRPDLRPAFPATGGSGPFHPGPCGVIDSKT